MLKLTTFRKKCKKHSKDELNEKKQCQLSLKMT